LINGKGVPIPEIKSIYQSLLNENERIKNQIVESIESNDYVRLSHLLTSRSKIQTAIKEVESLHENDLKNYVSTKERVSYILTNAAESLESKGEDVLLNVIKSLEKMNQSTHSLVTKSLDISSKAFSKGNQLNHKAGKLLLKKTSQGLSKLSDAINKKF
jgi:hypothetical protein